MASNAPVNADDVSTIGQRWYVLFIMMLAYTISIADRYVLSTLLGPISKELNLSDIGAASLGIPLALFYVLMGIPLSWLCDRSNRRTLLVACVAVWSLMTALTGYTRGYYDLLLARIGVAHGQMHERDLEKVMRDFVAQRFNVLLCSTIIETGIDVPTANTIVMARADKFGLAQLHQLRGRVGRSHHQAYAYLMVPDLDSLTKQAQQRLEAIQQMEELGSGFYLAMHDLEIRGAGEVLGENQSGNMMEVGFQLYNEMLSEAVRSLKAGKEPDLLSPLSASTDINLHAPALLPGDYCGDVHLRLSFYKKLATARTSDQIDTLLEEIVDRFGKLPPQAQTLIDVHRLRVLSQPYGVVKVDAAPGVINITFKPQPPVDPMAIIHLIQKNKHIKLAGNEKLRIERALDNPKDRAQMVRDVLRSLGQPLVEAKAAQPA